MGRNVTEAGSKAPPHYLLLHWGRTGAGPRLLLGLAEAFTAVNELSLSVSYACDTEFDSSFKDIAGDQLAVRTYRSTLGAILGLPRAVCAAVRIRRYIARQDVHGVISPMYSLWHSLLIRIMVPRAVPYVATVHDATQHPGDRNRVADYCAQLDRAAATTLIVMSKSVEVELRAKMDSDKPIVRTVHPAFSSGPRTPRTAPGMRSWTVGMFGRLRAYKGLDVFADAVSILRAEGYEISGIAVGSGYDSEERDRKPTSIAIVEKWVREEEVNALVASFDILVLPYREASQSGVLAIGLAEGVPAVVSPVGGLVEQVSESGCGVVAADMSASALADAIATLIADQDLYAQLSRNCIDAAFSDFSWARVAEDYRNAIAHADI